MKVVSSELARPRCVVWREEREPQERSTYEGKGREVGGEGGYERWLRIYASLFSFQFASRIRVTMSRRQSKVRVVKRTGETRSGGRRDAWPAVLANETHE